MKPAAEDHLIAAIYDAALEPARWPWMLGQLTEAIGAGTATLTIQDLTTGGGRAVSHNLNPASVEAHFRDHAGRSPFGRLYPDGRVPVADPRARTDSEFLAREELLRTDYYNVFLAPLELNHLLMMDLDVDGPTKSVLAFARPKRAFGARHLAVAERLRPHLRRALLLTRRIGSHAAVGASGLTSALGAALVASADRRIRAASPAAERLLQACDSLRLRHGRLVGPTAATTAQLSELVRAAAAGSSGGAMAVPRGSGRRPLALLVAPLSAERVEHIVGGPGSLIWISDPEAARHAPLERLTSVFGLTTAEARVTAALAAGANTREIALQLGVSFNTVRFHLANVRAKAGVQRQSELVSLVLRTLRPLPDA